MTIWLLAIVLLASLAALGYRQGGIRVAFSLVGILTGIVFAGWFAKPIKFLLVLVGVKSPVLPWLLAPLIVFVLVNIIFKSAAAAVHHKVDVYYKYRAGDLRLALWERLNARLGLCLGLVNGALYFLLLSFVIYDFSYWTVQMASPENDPKKIRLLNRLGEDLESSGFIHVARSIDPMPQVWYDAADLAGILFNNSLLEARLSRYPAFLGLAELPEFQGLGADQDFLKMRQQREPLMTLIEHPGVQGILNNPDLLRTIWAAVVPNMQDLRGFLDSGISPKFASEKLLGRWTFDPYTALNLLRRVKPIPVMELSKVKRYISTAYTKTTFVATIERRAYLKNLPPPPRVPMGNPTETIPTQTQQGDWKEVDGKYQVVFGGKEELPAIVDGERLVIKREGFDLPFTRED